MGLHNSEFKTYLFSYQHEGASWLLEIKAESVEDAKRRLSRLQYASYDGELVTKIVAPTGAGILKSLLKLLKWLFSTPK